MAVSKILVEILVNSPPSTPPGPLRGDENTANFVWSISATTAAVYDTTAVLVEAV